MKALIAEIGNCHLGNVHSAYRLIRMAKDCGATHVKMQAIDSVKPEGGSMPDEFYAQCSMSLSEYRSCVQYGQQINIPVFFSTFHKKFESLHTMYEGQIKKISGSQYENKSYKPKDNNKYSLISIPRFENLRPDISEMNIMHVTPYNYVYSDLSPIDILTKHYKKKAGYSDHSIGIENCKRAINQYECQLIEKHFYFGSNIKFKGQVYRDCYHSSSPIEFEKLAKYYHERVKL